MSEIERLRKENRRLRELLQQHGIADSVTVVQSSVQGGTGDVSKATLTTQQKVALFRRLFRGREDLYPVRWESNNGRSGYSPACGNEWKPGLCGKPKIKCGACDNRALLPLSDRVIYRHLSGEITVGVYPLLQTEQCHFLAIDFDKESWREDVQSIVVTCRYFQIPATIEISRSGNGAHLWIFFSQAVPSVEARQLGAALISYPCSHSRQLDFTSYDRMFPNQERMPKGGFGNLIALPLQKRPRDLGRSIFVDDQLHPYLDQWDHLNGLGRMDEVEIATSIQQLSEGYHVLDVAYIEEEALSETPWKGKKKTHSNKIEGMLPQQVVVTLANQVYFEKGGLTQPLANRLIRLAAFQNPEYYKAQQMRFSVWDKPRIIGCAENHPNHIALPRGCLDDVKQLLQDNGMGLQITDERYQGAPIACEFNGCLRKEQQEAVTVVIRHDAGVLCAPTAFGKTVTAASIIATRKVNTLIIVNRTDLLQQWLEQLQLFLECESNVLGRLGGGKRNPSLKIDVAVMQSLVRKGEVNEIVERYGQIIVDECHHISSVSFERLMKQVKARYVLGLTATPERRDGHQPVIFMQCGPIRHRAKAAETAPRILQVVPHTIASENLVESEKIQEIFQHLVEDLQRNRCIVKDAIEAYQQGRKVLLLTERTGHLGTLWQLLDGKIENLFLLHGRLSKKKRKTVKEGLQALSENEPRLLLATGRLIGEGFDHPPLDTLVLAMPVSWKGTLQQYAGRLHRDHMTKHDIVIHDYLDIHSSQLMKMWERRQKGYRLMKYQILSEKDLLGFQVIC